MKKSIGGLNIIKQLNSTINKRPKEWTAQLINVIDKAKEIEIYNKRLDIKLAYKHSYQKHESYVVVSNSKFTVTLTPKHIDYSSLLENISNVYVLRKK